MSYFNVPSSAKTLQVSYIGMKSEEAGVKSNMNVVLHPDAQAIDEVVVVGYGTVKKSELTGAISSVKSEDIANVPVFNISQALQGKVSGMQVISTSGRAGDETQISLRGNGSLSASTNVLYVIDGVPGAPFNSISPNDIENIEVLKDAASTAIYGSRASNGVVLVTTKSGAYDKKTSVTLNISAGVQNPVKTPKLLNVAQYGMVQNAAIQNYKDDIANGFQDAPKDPDVLKPFTPITENGTDWFDEILNKNAWMQNYQLGVSGGGSKTKFYLGASHLNQEGVVKMDQFKRSTIKLNLDHKIFNNFRIGVKSFFSASESIPLDENNSIYQPWSAALNARPDAPAMENGKPYRGTFTNPMFAFERKISDKWTRLGASAFFDWTIIKGLVWHASISGDINSERYNRYDASDTKKGESLKGSGNYSTAYYSDYIAENTLTYSNNIINKLFYTVLAGHSFQKFMEEESRVSGVDFPSTSLEWLDSAGKITDGGSSYTANALESYFGRIQLNWDNKYNLMFSIRGDGSSKFLSENRWGTFFAISGGWTISNEAFWNKDVVNMLKIRASYGQTGNQDGIGNASGQNLLNSGTEYNYNGLPGLTATRLFNKNLTWERGLATNFGVDVSFLENRINLSLNYYNKKTKDLLYAAPVATESGFRVMTSNLGEIKNQGIEVDFDADIIKNKNLVWNFNANFSYNKNEVVNLGDPTKNYYNAGFVSIIKEGEPLGSFELIKSLGVAQERTELKNKDGKVVTVIQPGDMLYEDVDGNGKINSADLQIFNGGIAPIYGGFGTSLTYAGFDLSLQAQYSIGKKVYAMYKEGGKGQMNGGAVGAPAYSSNMITDILDSWTPSNTNTDVPRLNLGGRTATWNTQRSSRFLEDANFLRISDITLGYNFKHLNLPFFSTLRAYVQVRNPFTFTKYSGLDPELQYVDPERENNKVVAGVDNSGIPNMRSFVFGINVAF
ncbi:MAG: TonB-dependent receptor [Bacteroides sp.]